jgi:hypothetical protein
MKIPATRNAGREAIAMHIHRSSSELNRTNPSWEDRWDQADKGLIISWEVGREMARRHPELARRAAVGELVPLSWKGGVNRPMKPNQKHGSLFYLAMWQGLRGDDLDIHTGRDTQLTCMKNSTVVTFTSDDPQL